MLLQKIEQDIAKGLQNFIIPYAKEIIKTEFNSSTTIEKYKIISYFLDYDYKTLNNFLATSENSKPIYELVISNKEHNELIQSIFDNPNDTVIFQIIQYILRYQVIPKIENMLSIPNWNFIEPSVITDDLNIIQNEPKVIKDEQLNKFAVIRLQDIILFGFIYESEMRMSQSVIFGEITRDGLRMFSHPAIRLQYNKFNRIAEYYPNESDSSLLKKFKTDITYFYFCK